MRRPFHFINPTHGSEANTPQRCPHAWLKPFSFSGMACGWGRRLHKGSPPRALLKTLQRLLIRFGGSSLALVTHIKALLDWKKQ